MSSMIRTLSERVQFYASKKIFDEMGGWSEEWVFEGAFWAHLKPITQASLSIDSSNAKRLGVVGVSSPLYQITVRKQVPLKAGLKLGWKEKTLIVISEPLLTPNHQGLSAYASLNLTTQGTSK